MCHSSNLNWGVKTFSCKIGQNCDFPIVNNGTRQGAVWWKIQKLHNLSPIGPYTALRKLHATVKTWNVKYTLSLRIPWSKIKTGSSIPDFDTSSFATIYLIVFAPDWLKWFKVLPGLWHIRAFAIGSAWGSAQKCKMVSNGI